MTNSSMMNVKFRKKKQQFDECKIQKKIAQQIHLDGNE